MQKPSGPKKMWMMMLMELEAAYQDQHAWLLPQPDAFLLGSRETLEERKQILEG